MASGLASPCLSEDMLFSSSSNATRPSVRQGLCYSQNTGSWGRGLMVAKNDQVSSERRSEIHVVVQNNMQKGNGTPSGLNSGKKKVHTSTQQMKPELDSIALTVGAVNG